MRRGAVCFCRPVGFMLLAGWCAVYGSCRSFLRRNEGAAVNWRRVWIFSACYLGAYYLLYVQLRIWTTSVCFLATLPLPLLAAVFSGNILLQKNGDSPIDEGDRG